MTIAFKIEEIDDPVREIRVVASTPTMVSCERSGHRCGKTFDMAGERRCRVMFLANVPMHGRADYLVLYGNQFR
ncbi:MAG: hypothetical protein R3C02_09035 [Planctomycetaceae bacterium]